MPERGGSIDSQIPGSRVPEPDSAWDVFVSYASDDTAVANAVVASLERQGIKCWIAPRDVAPGALYADEIIRAINSSKVLLLVLSKSAAGSPHVGKEIERATSKRRPIITLRTDAVPLTTALEYFLSESQWVDLGADGTEVAFSKLATAVRHHLTGSSVVEAGHQDGATQPLAQQSTSSPSGAEPSQRLSRPVLLLGALIALVVAYLAADKLWLTKHTVGERPVAALTPTPVPAAASIRDKSVAVLPFVDMSEKKDQEYFSDGLSEELIDLLTKVAGLRVPARTSSFSFKGKQTTVSEISKALNVSHVLEGSVRKAGNRLRIVAELIDARTDTHLWSHAYDRELTDVFKVQDEIAASVVTQLRITLLGAAPESKTTDPKAYTLFLEGLHYGRQYTKEGFERSISLYGQALAIDSNYAAAWDGLARNYINQTTNGLRPRDEGSRLAREAANRAISIDPEFASAYARLGSIAARFDGDFVTAAKLFERALALQPSNSTIVGNAANLAYLVGRLDTAIALQKYTNARDPLSGIGHENLGIFYVHAGRPDEALAELHAALSLNPKQLLAYSWISRALLLKDDPKAALTAIQQEPEDELRLAGLAMASYALRQKADSDAALAELIKRGEDASVASVLAFRGEPNRAFEWLEKAASKNELQDNSIATDPDFANLRRDARWLPFLRKIGVAPDQLAPIRFDVKLPE
jgi:TolB-like protein/Flp pilus assembly protein TadD